MRRLKLITLALASAATTACIPPSATPNAVPDRAPVSVNHVYAYLDSATMAAVEGSSFVRDTFADFRRETNTDADGSSWTALYLTGEQTYLELFPASTQTRPAGFTGLALSVEVAGALDSVATRLEQATGLPLYRQPARMVTRGDTVPWFKQVSVIYPGYPGTLAEVYTWVIENEPAFFREYIGDSTGSDSDISRRRYLAKRYRPERLMRDITGLALALSPDRGARLLAELAAHGWRVERGNARGRGRAYGPEGAVILVERATRAKPAGLRMVQFTVQERGTDEPAGERMVELGPRSRLAMHGDGTATWGFDSPPDEVPRFADPVLASLSSSGVRAGGATPAGGTAWVTAAIGGSEDFIGVAVSLARERPHPQGQPGVTFMGRIVTMEEFCVFGCDHPASHAELGALLGVTTGTRHVTLTVAAGGALVIGRLEDDGSGANHTYATVGLPLVAELGLRPFSAVGLSGAVALTPTRQRTVPMLLVGLQIGSLHPKP